MAALLAETRDAIENELDNHGGFVFESKAMMRRFFFFSFFSFYYFPCLLADGTGHPTRPQTNAATALLRDRRIDAGGGNDGGGGAACGNRPRGSSLGS